MKDLCSEKEPLHWPFSPFRQSSESSYRSTVLLPSTSFPARIEGQARVDRDRQVVKSHEFTSLYDRQKSSQEGRPRFVLHDGPPYANGDVHLGHAVNKILKDVFCRWKLLTGILFLSSRVLGLRRTPPHMAPFGGDGPLTLISISL